MNEGLDKKKRNIYQQIMVQIFFSKTHYQIDQNPHMRLLVDFIFKSKDMMTPILTLTSYKYT